MSVRDQYDGFISIRQGAEPVCYALNTLLARRNLSTAWQANINEFSARSHMDGVQQIIRNTDFSIVLVTPNLFEPPPDQSRCHQKDELIAISERLSRVGHESDGSGGLKYSVFLALLQNENGHPQHGDLVSSVKDDQEISWIRDATNWCVIPNFEDVSDQRRNEAIEKLVGDVYLWATRHSDIDFGSRGPRSQTNDAPSPDSDVEGEGPPGGADRGDPAPESVSTIDLSPLNQLQKTERAYLERGARLWHRGRIDRVEDVALDESPLGADESPFSFDPQRFIELFAQFDHSSEPSRTTSAMPVSEFFFHAWERPLILQGEAGVGKSTTAAAVALAMASTWHDVFARFSGRLANGTWRENAVPRINRGLQWFPVLTRCSWASKFFTDGNPDVDRLLDIITMVLLGTDEIPSPDAREDLRERMSNQPYALLFDGLDEVEESRKGMALVHSAVDLWNEINRGDQKLRVLILTREFKRNIADVDKASLKQLSWNQISNFLSSYALSAGEQQNEAIQSHIFRDAEELWRGGGVNADPLKTPLLLNAFCWMEINRGSFKGNRTEFCRNVIDYLAANRRIVARPGEVLSSDKVRKLLQRLAYDATSSDLGRGIMTADDAEQVVESWGRSVIDHHLSGEQCRAILQQVSHQTGLLYRMRSSDGSAYYSFEKRELFREYLAGERMAEGGLTHQTIRQLRATPEKLQQWEPAIGFAAAMRSEDTDVHTSMKLPTSLLDSAQASDAAPEAYLWSSAALTTLVESARRLELPDFSSYIDKILTVYRKHKSEWTPLERSLFAERMMLLARKTNAKISTTIASHLFDKFLDGSSQWLPLADQPGLSIARTPVLVFEYRQFLEDNPTNKRYWTHARLPEEKNLITETHSSADGGHPEPDGGAQEHWTSSDQWNRQMDRPGNPVVFVTWFEAVAYCAWKTRTMRESGDLDPDEVVRLPTVEEWMSIVRFVSKGERYPWGNASLRVGTSAQAVVNSYHSGVHGTSVPGVFDSYGLDGLYDFGSNTRSWLANDTALADRIDEEEDVPTAGGSWADFEVSLFRSNTEPRLEDPLARRVFLGFRVVKARPS